MCILSLLFLLLFRSFHAGWACARTPTYFILTGGHLTSASYECDVLSPLTVLLLALLRCSSARLISPVSFHGHVVRMSSFMIQT